MASIITPGNSLPTGEENPPKVPETTVYLKRDNYLREYADDENVDIIRDVLNVLSKDLVYSKEEIKNVIINAINNAINEHLSQDDPHGIDTAIDNKLENERVVRSDRKTLFTNNVSGPNPKENADFVNKGTLEKYLSEHSNTDAHNILPLVDAKLANYVKFSDFNTLVYTKEEIEKLSERYAKQTLANHFTGDNTFTKAVIGADPKIDSHLSTKRYVDKVMDDHRNDIDPHSFLSILNNRLKSYIKANQVYDKAHTYSRDLLDSIIRSLVLDAATEVLNDHLNESDPHRIIDEIRKENYVKQNGTVPFTSPLAGVDAENLSLLATLRQVKKESELIKKIIDQLEPTWKTSGPVESTVGHVEDNTYLHETMTLQEIMDAIFYGKGICLEVPEYVIITETCPVTMCIHGSTGVIQYAELYLNGELIYTFQKDDFAEGCVTVDSLPLYGDAEFKFKVYYTSGATHEEVRLVKCYMPIFIGLLPKWKFANTVTFDYLIELCKEDTEGTQNRFLNYKEDYVAEPKEGYGKDLKSVTFKYSFVDPKLRRPFIVLPKDYSDLKSISINSQQFNLAAFDVIDQIPMQVPGVDHDMIYKIYVYRQALSRLDSEVTFNFTPRNE